MNQRHLLRSTLHKYLLELAEECNPAYLDVGINQGPLAEKIANVVAALEVLTDASFTEEEQERLWDISAQRHKELKGE
ncbi:MAG TPA: hypothetical protein VF077_09770 [Nitrospiraceae bacterium]